MTLSEKTSGQRRTAIMLRYTMVVAGALACLYVAGCGQTDKTNETVEKAKNLKAEMQKTVDKVKEGMADRTEELARKAIKDADKPDDSAEKGNRED
jgi:outer membrane murein-binding lipoprotein Lpp